MSAPQGTGDGFGDTLGDLDSWRRGDEEAEARIVGRILRTLGHIIRRDVHSISGPLKRHLDVSDLVHEAWLVIQPLLRSFDAAHHGSLLTWVKTIASNTVRDRLKYLRAARRSPDREQALDGIHENPTTEATALIDPSSGPGTRAGLLEAKAEIDAALDKLEERERDILMSRCLGLSWDQIARDTGSPSSEAVRKAHARILDRLAENLPDFS